MILVAKMQFLMAGESVSSGKRSTALFNGAYEWFSSGVYRSSCRSANIHLWIASMNR